MVPSGARMPGPKRVHQRLVGRAAGDHHLAGDAIGVDEDRPPLRPGGRPPSTSPTRSLRSARRRARRLPAAGASRPRPRPPGRRGSPPRWPPTSAPRPVAGPPRPGALRRAGSVSTVPTASANGTIGPGSPAPPAVVGADVDHEPAHAVLDGVDVAGDARHHRRGAAGRRLADGHPPPLALGRAGQHPGPPVEVEQARRRPRGRGARSILRRRGRGGAPRAGRARIPRPRSPPAGRGRGGAPRPGRP